MAKLSYIAPILAVDPEFFVTNKDGKVICSEKALPLPVSFISRYGYDIQVVTDGVQGEIQPTGSTCRESLVTYLRIAIDAIQGAFALNNLHYNTSTVVTVDKMEIDSGGENCRQIGCNPSMNAYTGDISPRPSAKDYAKRFYREAGGHLHCITNANQFPRDIKSTVKALDAFVGTLGVIGAQDRQAEEVIRREVVGKAGEYRTRAYNPFHMGLDEVDNQKGLEYRVLSNHWLCHSAFYSLYHGIMREVFDYYRYNPTPKLEFDSEKVINIINNSNVDEATKLWKDSLLEQYALELTKNSEWNFPHPTYIDNFLNMIEFAPTPSKWSGSGFNSNWYKLTNQVTTARQLFR